MSESPALTFTGERFTTDCVREIWYEHWHRYTFACGIAAGKRVLDAACGEGYGSALLSRVAADVIGVDIDANTIAHAQARYAGLPRLRFEQKDAAVLGYAGASFDLVVSFETLEHLKAQEELVRGFSQVLTTDGALVISSPDKRTYSDATGFRNEFHVRELYREELLALLQPHFRHIRLYHQKLLFQSAIWTEDATVDRGEAWTVTSVNGDLVRSFDYEPIYYVAVCSNEPIPASLPRMSLFGDRQESVYAHYNHEIRKNMTAGARIAELEAELERLRGELNAARENAHNPASQGLFSWLTRNRTKK
ncbi:MAG: methyltransferase domain-containing protein [Dokdonella sp.]